MKILLFNSKKGCRVPNKIYGNLQVAFFNAQFIMHNGSVAFPLEKVNMLKRGRTMVE